MPSSGLLREVKGSRVFTPGGLGGAASLNKLPPPLRKPLEAIIKFKGLLQVRLIAICNAANWWNCQLY